MPIITVTRNHLRELQKMYSERALDQNNDCIARWIYRLANHLQVDAQQYLEPYVDSSDDEADVEDSANHSPHLDDRIYVNIHEPLVASVQDEEDAEEEYVHEDTAYDYEE